MTRKHEKNQAFPEPRHLSPLPNTPASEDGSMLGLDPQGFYQVPNSMLVKAINGNLTGADWKLWGYLQAFDPHGDRLKNLPKVSDIVEAIKVSPRQIKRSLKRLEELGLYYWEPVVIRGQNLAGKLAKEMCQQKKQSKSSHANKMTNSSTQGQDCPPPDKIVHSLTNSSTQGQDCPNQPPEPAPDKPSSAPHNIQTYTDYIKTLSEGERENFLEFGKKKAAQLPRPPELPIKWVEAHWEELRSQWEATEAGRTAKNSQTDWTQHPDWGKWLDFMRVRGVPTFVALGEEWFDRKKRREIANWADERNLIWGAES